jgi:hypothetical protein
MSIIDSGDDTRLWRKASYSVGNGECVEVSSAYGRVSVRDSKDPNGPALSYSVGDFLSFLEAAKRANSW